MQGVFFRCLASSVDLAHAVLMLAWGLGLPLLFWHRWPRLSRAQAWFVIGFVGTSLLSQLTLGECVLTTLARRLWLLGGGYRDDVPFVVVCVNTIAHIRPSTRAAVLVWELAVALSAAGVAWHFARAGRPGQLTTGPTTHRQRRST